MNAKTSKAKVEAFLRAFEETGNQTLAAEQAGLCRSTVRNLRRADPGFDSRWRAAKARSERRLAESGCNRPPPAWKRRGGIDLAVQRAGKRPAKVVRSGRIVWTARTEARLLGRLRQCANARLACRWAGVTLSSYEAHLRRWPDFRRRVEEARAFGRLRVAAAAEAERPFEVDWERAETLPRPSIAEALRVAIRARRG